MRKLIFTLGLLSSFNALAWGPTGHRVVGEVAQKFLKINTLMRVHQILKGQNLARVSTWPDEIKSEPQIYSHTFKWHYTTWSQDVHDHSEHNESESTGFLLKSINEQLAVLNDITAVEDKKVFALKFLVHLVGDLHQPLHVGSRNDMGGNLCKVQFHGRVTNLHALWDEDLIEATKLSYTELSSFISQGLTAEKISEIKKGTIISWAQESKNINSSLYPTEPNNYCQKEVPSEMVPKLGFEYSYQFMPIVERRLLEAGLRLAELLNQNLK
jgi:hypothetical protein